MVYTNRLDMMVSMIKNGETAKNIDKILREQTFWLEIMENGTNSAAVGNWNDWFIQENYEKVI